MGKEDQGRPVRVDDAIAEDCRVLGITLDLPAEDEADGFPVWDSNWETVRLWLELETQWRVVAGFSGLVWLGLDHVAAHHALDRRFGRRRADRGRAAALFEDLRVMEKEALKTFREIAE